MAELRLQTERLVLRDWRAEDIDDFHRLGSDPEVMQTLGPLMSREQSAALIEALAQRAANDGHTFWAAERKQDSRVIGFIGLTRCRVPTLDGELEIGWRLARDCWGQGFAIEGAQASQEWARRNCADKNLIAITAEINTRSRALMERLGMSCRPDRAFDHPNVPEGSPLRPHVLYEKELRK